MHHCLSQATVRRQKCAIIKLKRVLVQCNIFHGPSKDMFKLLSKEIVPDNVKNSILSTEQVGLSAYRRFVEERLTGSDNLWTKMTKVKLLSWSSSAKDIRLKAGYEVLTLKQYPHSLPGCQS